ncbi:MAG: hypothetical protein U9N01_04480 [Euryarchaeota archaeon]|nr:hypothetical protein [Euryarchaeota archaeon]
MMKKITMSAVLVMCILIVGTVTAAVEITTSTQIIGNGTYDAEVMMQSENRDSGLKYYGESYTPALGLFGDSEVMLSSEYILTRANESELMIAEESEISNIRCKRCFKNYELGTLQVFNTFGDYSVMAEFGGDVNMSMMMVEATISGRGRTEVVVRDLNASHFYIVKDCERFNGNYKVEKSSLIERVEEPRADMNDWLGCPGAP